jgi:spore germination protein GerM
MKQASYTMQVNEAAAAAKCVKDNNFFTAKALGYSKYFYVFSSDKNITDEELKVTADMTKSKMAAAFNKLQNGKKSNRLLVSKFAEELAVA